MIQPYNSFIRSQIKSQSEVESLSYEDVLSISAPMSTLNADHRSSSDSSPRRHPSEASISTVVEKSNPPPPNTSVHSMQARPRSTKCNFEKRPIRSADVNRVRTPQVPEELRAHIRRQCSMPSYAVLAKADEPSSVNPSNETGPQEEVIFHNI